MSAAIWYWLVLVLWIVFRGISVVSENPRIRHGGDFVLIVLLVLIGFMVAGSPLK